jgi:hypothetical protein
MANTKTTEPTITLADIIKLEETRTAAQREAGRLQTLIRNRVEVWETRRATQTVLTAHGTREQRDVEVPMRVTKPVDRLERLRALRALPDAEEALLLAEEQLERGRATFTEAQRERRAVLVARLDQEAAAEMTKVFETTDKAAGLWHMFAAASRRRDAELLTTEDRGAFAMPRYTDQVFWPLADAPEERSQWALFRARLTDAAR